MKARYWLSPFTEREWDLFLRAGAREHGFRDNKWGRIQRIEMGDMLVCYLVAKEPRFFGLLKVTELPYQSSKPIYGYEEYSSRLRVRRVEPMLPPDQGLPVEQLRDQISWLRGDWSSYINWAPQDSEKAAEAAVIVAALRRRKETLDSKQAKRKPSVFSDRIRPFTPGE